MRIALVLSALAAAFLAAGCGGARHAATTAPTTTAATTTLSGHACVLSAKQRAAVAVVMRDIRRLHHLEAPLTTYSQKGTPALQAQTGKVLMDIGRIGLPINTRERLIRLAKAAVGLCGLCFGALEADEPAVESRFGHAECTGR